MKNFIKRICLSLSDSSALWIRVRIQIWQSVAWGNVSLCWQSCLVWRHIVFTDVPWMRLALTNWLGTGAVKMCEQPWAVSSQHTNNAPFDSLCPRSDTVQEQKPRRTPCWNKELLQKDRSNVSGTCQAGYCSADLTSYSLVSRFVGVHLSFSKDLWKVYKS